MPSRNRRKSARRNVPQQIDLFAGNVVTGGMPEWSALPQETRATLTSLMTRLMLDYADKRRIVTEGSHDH
jgi:hypothetical protein